MVTESDRTSAGESLRFFYKYKLTKAGNMFILIKVIITIIENRVKGKLIMENNKVNAKKRL